MPVERHRAAAQPLGQPRHRQRPETVGIGQFDGCGDDALAAQPT